jgi:hypothetical protein
MKEAGRTSLGHVYIRCLRRERASINCIRAASANPPASSLRESLGLEWTWDSSCNADLFTANSDPYNNTQI